MKKVNLMISTDASGKGGIATVVSGYIKENLLKDCFFIPIFSHSSANNNKFLMIATFVICIIKLIYYGIFYKIGIVHLHMASRGSYFRKSRILRIAKLFGAKTIIHLHGGEFNKFYNEESSQSKQYHIRTTFNLADKIIVLSKRSFHWVNTIVNDTEKVCIIYNAVPEINFPKKNTHHQIILFLGHLTQNKGVEVLINAFAKIVTKYPDIEMQFGGDGNQSRYETQIANLGITGKVKFLGWVSGDVKNQHLANATIYCLPSYNEGFPMGVLEAMSANVAIIASTAGGIPDAITDQQEGLLIEAGDVNALASALKTLMENDALRNQYINAAKIKYKNNFSPEATIPQLQRIYSELLEQK